MSSATTRSLRLALLVFMAVGMTALVKVTPLGDWIQHEARGFVARGGSLAIIGYPLVFAAMVSLGVPVVVLTVAGGVMFDLWPGALVNVVGAGLGAGGGFWIGRFIGRAAVEEKFGKWLARIDALERPWVTFVSFCSIRLNPFLPGSAFALGGGVTKAPFWPYLAGSALGTTPAVLAWTWFASEVGDGDATAGQGAILALALGGIAVVSTVPGLVALWRRRVSSRS